MGNLMPPLNLFICNWSEYYSTNTRGDLFILSCVYREMTWRPFQATFLYIKLQTLWPWSGHQINWWMAMLGSWTLKKGQMKEPNYWDLNIVFAKLIHWPVSISVSLSVYWDYAMTIRLEEIVYLHCHQQGNSPIKVLAAMQSCAI